MSQQRMHRVCQMACALFCILPALALPSLAAASAYHGQVTFHGWPVPGATVTVTQGAAKANTVTDQGGLYSFENLAEGPAKIEIEMQCFSTIEAEITIAPNMPAGAWELTLLPLDQIVSMARSKLAPSTSQSLTSAASSKKSAATDSTTSN
ncbi:MAG TPA: carboxypeptidase-like regulatory domain-containing protein, partial [Candidatus Sulfotelmatobacter sp.]